jgi:hypothetical protein
MLEASGNLRLLIASSLVVLVGAADATVTAADPEHGFTAVEAERVLEKGMIW